MTKIFELVWAFLQVGITAFGGGLSTLPLIEYQLVIKNGWMTGDGFNQLVAISQVTPGPIAINAATFAGYQQAGFWGSLAATLALVSAPVAALCVILAVLKRHSRRAEAGFTGRQQKVQSHAASRRRRAADAVGRLAVYGDLGKRMESRRAFLRGRASHKIL